MMWSLATVESGYQTTLVQCDRAGFRPAITMSRRLHVVVERLGTPLVREIKLEDVT